MSLSARQSEVVSLVLQGLSNREIANRLLINEKTVKFHLTDIYKTLGVKSRAQLIVDHLHTRNETDAFNDFLKSDGG